MKAVLAFLWSGCWHRWEVYRAVDVVERGRSVPWATDYELSCKRCGNMKRVRL